MATRTRTSKATTTSEPVGVKRVIGKPVEFTSEQDGVTVRFVCSPVSHDGKLLTNGSRMSTYIGSSKFAAKTLPLAAVVALSELHEDIASALDALDKNALIGAYSPTEQVKATPPAKMADVVSNMTDEQKAALLALLTS